MDSARTEGDRLVMASLSCRYAASNSLTPWQSAVQLIATSAPMWSCPSCLAKLIGAGMIGHSIFAKSVTQPRGLCGSAQVQPSRVTTKHAISGSRQLDLLSESALYELRLTHEKRKGGRSIPFHNEGACFKKVKRFLGHVQSSFPRPYPVFAAHLEWPHTAAFTCFRSLRSRTASGAIDNLMPCQSAQLLCQHA